MLYNSFFKLKPLISFFSFILLFSFSAQAQFTKIVGANGLDHNSTGTRNNGHAWGDVDNDGDLDVIMHVGAGGSLTNGKLFLNSGSPNYTFTDVTNTKIDGFNDNVNFGRQMLIADFNNDGYNDILRGFGSSIDTEIYYNDGPPNYTFGLPTTQQPDVLIGAPATGNHNTEGIVAIDWNQDGWLDLVIDNDDGGNDIYENDQAGGFVYQTPGTSTGQTGFPASHAGDGDYMTAADIDNDGYVDLYGRKTAVTNYWRFDSALGQFVTQANPNIVSNESDKGGTMFCDFDNDGDLDLFWTTNGDNQIWRNDGSGTWVATGLPGGHVESTEDIDGCDCGDMDNDGDLDIILGNTVGYSYIMENTTSGGVLSFDLDSIHTDANTESITFTDFDNDGDLDIYTVVVDAANQLWENSTDGTNYLYVNAMFDNGGSTSRDAIGANVFLTNCEGDTTGMRQVNGGKGHGSQHQKKVHFGLDPTKEYIVEVHYVYDSTLLTRTVVKKAIVPSNLPNQEITILNTDASEVFYCQDTDADGALDYIDLDDDNDGIPDVSEDTGTGFDPHGDADGDGILNVFDDSDVTGGFPTFTDANGDGLNDAYDSDGDGIPDYIDLDADNDGIPDIIEAGGIDTNGDGQIDYPTANDPTSMVDVDSDGLADALDNQDSGAGGSEVTSGTPLSNADSDKDGLSDAVDLDADNDGLPDLVEIGGIDTNGDGMIDITTDADNDGFADVYDPDNDGTPGVDSGSDDEPLVETNGTGDFLNGETGASLDSDGDGKNDHLDLDADNDGLPDLVEAGGVDTNGDGLVDTTTDADNDGFADIFDTDDDGTLGVEDATDALLQTGGTDTDGDGKADDAAIIFQNGESVNADSDGDGKADHLDLDADNDGLPDLVEAGGVDTNGDGLVDTTTDADNDGFADIFDTDDDGILGVEDATDALVQTGGTDTDADGKADDAAITYINGESVSVDKDGDGNPDHLDLDADNDGLPDLVEAGGVDTNGDGLVDTTTDADGDGFADIFDTDDDGILGVEDATDALVQTGGTDTDADGKADDVAITYINGESVSVDKDGDGNPDHLDLDSDNDGLPDLVEAGGIDTNGDGLTDILTDADNDGFSDIYDTDNNGIVGIDDATLALIKTGGTDTDNDGKADDAAITFVDGDDISADTDSDGLPDHLDLDADNDGIPDLLEAGGSSPNNDGMVDVIAAPWDSDNDGLADVYDENNSGTSLVETTADTNADGKVNATETMTAGGTNNINFDNHGLPNHLDLDADNDGVTDVVENAAGAVSADESGVGNLDGIIDNYTDSGDNNGWNDSSTTATTDTDSDGIPDYLDIDADNDGIVDYLESVCSICPTFIIDPAVNNTDTDGDGVLDIYENVSSDNTDNTTGTNTGITPNVDDNSGNITPDYLDTDTDSDGAFDWTEGYDVNNDGKAVDDIMGMATTYEGATSNGFYLNATDSDSDGIPDYMDNQPLTAGYDEATRPPFLDQSSPFWHDVDGDGLVDLFDTSEGGTNAPTPDNTIPGVGVDDKDWRDVSAVISLPVELVSFEGVEKDCAVELVWKTASEKDFDYFIIEWSGDGHDFLRIGLEMSSGNANGDMYKFLDKNSSQVNYYRLKMVDLDGSFEYSNIVFIGLDCENENDVISIYPNPVFPNQKLSIEFISKKESEQIMFVDMLGRVVKRISIETEEGKNTLDLDVSNLAIGTYQLQIVGSRISKMIMIQE